MLKGNARGWLAWHRGYTIPKYRDKLTMAVVWRLPRWAVYWSGVRLFAHGTTGRYGNTLAPTLTVVDALERWRDHGQPEPPALGEPQDTPAGPPTVAR